MLAYTVEEGASLVEQLQEFFFVESGLFDDRDESSSTDFIVTRHSQGFAVS